MSFFKKLFRPSSGRKPSKVPLDHNGCTELMNLCALGDAADVERLLAERPDYPLEVENRVGWTALHKAAGRPGGAAVVEALIKAGQ